MSDPLGAVDHVAIAVWRESVPAARRFMTEVLGARAGFLMDRPDFSFQHFHLGDTKFEVLWPTSDDSFLTRFLEKRGEGLHHITLLVDDLEECCTRLEAQEIAVVGKDTSQPRWQQAFISPRSAFGVLYQLAQPRQRRKRAPE